MLAKMAKIGEGDPRWIVTERQDGANVNGWHWQEKNCMGFAKERLTELLVGLQADIPAMEGNATVTELNKIEGDAALNIRKGNKKFAVFDLTVTLKWEGEWTGHDEKVKGEVKLSEFASTNDEDEYEYKVTTSDGSKEAKNKLKAKLEKGVHKLFLPKLEEFIKEMSAL